MAYIQKDRVKETTTTNGTGAVTLAGAVAGFQAFSAVMSVADTCYYVIVSATGTDWETGTGTYSSASVLTRTTVLSSSNSGNAVSFTSGTKDVFMGPVAERVTDIAHGGTGATTAAGARTNLGVSTGTVTSVAGAGTVSGLTLTGTVTSSGSLTLGGAISTLNQNTTGNAATVTTNANLTGHITSSGNAAVLGSFTSAQLAGALSDETGTGANVFATSPTLVTPLANSLSAVPVTSGAGNSLTIAAGSGVTSGAGANLILNPGEQVVTGGRGIVLIDGLNAGKSKSSGVDNTVFGAGALAAITTGSYNVAIGFEASSVNTTGENTAVGFSALRLNTTGYSNTAVGSVALRNNVTGIRNAAFGEQSLDSCTNNENTAFGYYTLRTLTSGIGNTVIGAMAGANPYIDGLTTGQNNILVGRSATTGPGNNGVNNSIVIGAYAVGNGSNTTTIGNSSTTATWLYGYVKSTVYTVATLTAAATAGAGARAFVSDSTATTFAAVVAGGGANGVPVYSDGTNWRIG